MKNLRTIVLLLIIGFLIYCVIVVNTPTTTQPVDSNIKVTTGLVKDYYYGDYKLSVSIRFGNFYSIHAIGEKTPFVVLTNNTYIEVLKTEVNPQSVFIEGYETYYTSVTWTYYIRCPNIECGHPTVRGFVQFGSCFKDSCYPEQRIDFVAKLSPSLGG